MGADDWMDPPTPEEVYDVTSCGPGYLSVEDGNLDGVYRQHAGSLESSRSSANTVQVDYLALLFFRSTRTELIPL